MTINEIFALVALIGMFVGVAAMLLFFHKSASKARIEQLFVNHHGEFDIAAVLLWIGVGVLGWVLVFCTLKGHVPEGIGAIYGVFATAVVGPLIAKVIFKEKMIPGASMTQTTTMTDAGSKT